MICQACGVEAPTQKVFFVRHIGAIIMFFHARIGGEFCRNCVNKYFFEYGGTTLILGWWGLISVFATPVVLIIDIFNYFRAWNLEPVPDGAREPRLDDMTVQKLQPLTPNLVERLNKGEKLPDVARDVAMAASVTPGQVVVYVRALAAQSRAAQARR
jgi:hypothetical protein